ncbi:hypothetical protein AAVH_34312, partial [Aphelenchoides avenae]
WSYPCHMVSALPIEQTTTSAHHEQVRQHRNLRTRRMCIDRLCSPWPLCVEMSTGPAQRANGWMKVAAAPIVSTDVTDKWRNPLDAPKSGYALCIGPAGPEGERVAKLDLHLIQSWQPCRAFSTSITSSEAASSKMRWGH